MSYFGLGGYQVSWEVVSLGWRVCLLVLFQDLNRECISEP